MITPREKPVIHYPCPWSYRIIGTHEGLMRMAIRALVGEDAYDLERGNTSRTGKYVSLKLTLTVRDEAHRLGIARTLLREDVIRYVL